MIIKTYKLKKNKLNEYNIYYYEDNFVEIAELILAKKFKIVKELKKSKRNYVAIIEIQNKRYVYKEPRNEYRIIQRKLMTIFKEGEALRTLINTNKIQEQGIDSVVKTYLAVNSRKNGMINFSFLLMEYIEEKQGDIDKIKKGIIQLKNIHKLGYYHGDFNPSNILLQKNNEVKLIDTQLKKSFFGKYRLHYDMITMQYDSWKEMEYPYYKDVYYYIAYGMKRFKRLSWIEKIGEIRKKIRNKWE